MILIVPAQVERYFPEISADVIASDDPADAFEVFNR